VLHHPILRRTGRGVAVLAAIVLVVSSACTSATSPPPAPGASTPPVAASPSIGPSESSRPSEAIRPTGAPAIELLTSDVARQATDPATASAAASVVNAFGLDLYRATPREQANKNVVISPASVAIALSMVQVGAAGKTADQVNTVLHDLVAAGEIRSINALDQALTSRTGTFKDTAGADQPVILRIANAPFGARDLAIEPAYLDTLARGFGAGLRTVDYMADPAAARALINGWVADHTEQRIKELLAESDVTSDTRLVLVNAIYLKAAWLTPFAEEATVPAAFSLADGTNTQVPTMSTFAPMRYAAGSGWQAVELPYVGDQLSMMIVVPDDLSSFRASLTADRFADLASALDSGYVRLTLPKFGVRIRQDLATVLADLGMPLAFSAEADFSGITTEERLFISKIIHEADIAIDEAGTEAAAATAVVMGDISGPGEPVTVHVDRPFVFAIRDVQTGAVLFLGQVTDPSTQD
jgi:serpin B